MLSEMHTHSNPVNSMSLWCYELTGSCELYWFDLEYVKSFVAHSIGFLVRRTAKNVSYIQFAFNQSNETDRCFGHY
jgi:hypothetical protein